jgi:hypothetical protein
MGGGKTINHRHGIAQSRHGMAQSTDRMFERAENLSLGYAQRPSTIAVRAALVTSTGSWVNYWVLEIEAGVSAIV